MILEKGEVIYYKCGSLTRAKQHKWFRTRIEDVTRDGTCVFIIRKTGRKKKFMAMACNMKECLRLGIIVPEDPVKQALFGHESPPLGYEDLTFKDLSWI